MQRMEAGEKISSKAQPELQSNTALCRSWKMPGTAVAH
jgi:hypothetical protein